MRTLSALLVVASLGFTGYVLHAKEPTRPEELGSVTWLRDIDAASKRAKASGLPMFVQFQEVPG